MNGAGSKEDTEDAYENVHLDSCGDTTMKPVFGDPKPKNAPGSDQGSSGKIGDGVLKSAEDINQGGSAENKNAAPAPIGSSHLPSTEASPEPNKVSKEKSPRRKASKVPTSDYAF